MPAALPQLDKFPELDVHQPYFAVRPALRQNCGNAVAALEDYEEAMALEQDASIRSFLAQKRSKVRMKILQ